MKVYLQVNLLPKVVAQYTSMVFLKFVNSTHLKFFWAAWWQCLTFRQKILFRSRPAIEIRHTYVTSMVYSSQSLAEHPRAYGFANPIATYHNQYVATSEMSSGVLDHPPPHFQIKLSWLLFYDKETPIDLCRNAFLNLFELTVYTKGVGASCNLVFEGHQSYFANRPVLNPFLFSVAITQLGWLRINQMSASSYNIYMIPEETI